MRPLVILFWGLLIHKVSRAPFFFCPLQDIELVQVLHLLCGVGMQIIAMDPVLIMLVVLHAAVKLVAGGTLVDIESLLPLLFEEGLLLADHLVELLMDLDLVRGLGWVEIIQMFDQGKETGSAQILCKFIN